MDAQSSDKYHQLAKRIAVRADEPQRAVLRDWIEQLLELRASNTSNLNKAKKAIALTANSQFLTSTSKLIAGAATPTALQELADKLVAINASSAPKADKIARAIKLVAASLKSLAWDKRSLPARLALSGAIATAVLFGGQGAGIAALGTAIGVPLWVVFGAGAAFLGVLYEEIAGKTPNPKTTFRIIEAVQETTGSTAQTHRNRPTLDLGENDGT